MLFVITPELILLEVTNATRLKLAAALKVPPAMVAIQWDLADDGKMVPHVEVNLPPALPPAEIDVNDAEAMAAWERDVAEMPDIHDFLRAKGVDDPGGTLQQHVQMMQAELLKRMGALETA